MDTTLGQLLVCKVIDMNSFNLMFVIYMFICVRTQTTMRTGLKNP